MASANQVTPVHLKNIGHKNWRSPLVEGTILFLKSTEPSTEKENAYGQVYMGIGFGVNIIVAGIWPDWTGATGPD
jgi:hypothetical protein